MPLIYRNKIMMSDVPYLYLDRIYTVKDIILKLRKQGDLNQTSLLSFCERASYEYEYDYEESRR